MAMSLMMKNVTSVLRRSPFFFWELLLIALSLVSIYSFVFPFSDWVTSLEINTK